MQPWLADRRAARARTAVRRGCPKCKTEIIYGVDADTAGIPVRCDPAPLTPLGEAVALLQGRKTYDLIKGKTGAEIHPRDETHIKKPRRHPVHATHICGNPLTAFAETANPQKGPETGDPPF